MYLAIGLILGSFINMAAWRIPRGLSLISPRSRCIHCGHTLGALELIPVISYLIQLGRCRSCGQQIPVRYLLVELTAGSLWLLATFTAVSQTERLLHGLFASVLLLAVIIDLEHMRIPDVVSLAGLVLAMTRWGMYGFPWSWVAVALGIFGMTFILTWFGFGGGDVKLATVIGLYLGSPLAIPALLLAFLSGGLIGVLLMTSGLRSRRDAIPFGPFLALGAVVMIFWGDALWSWYLHALGL